MEFDKAYNRETFLQFLRVDFLPDDFSQEILTTISLKTQTTYISSAVKLGVCKSLDLVVYEIKHRGKNDPRVGLSKEAFRLLTDEWQDKALIIFVPENNNANYRFSLITIDLDENENGNTTRQYSNPRRYSYYLGKDISYYTPNKYLNSGLVKNEKDLLSRFSVEVLTKAFYNELSDWYAWAVKIVKFPNKISDKTDDDKCNTEGIIRLITRLIFVWFLKQKHLVPNEFFDEKYIADNLIDGFNPHAVDLFGKLYESKYYKAILQNLFFAMLNSPITPEGKDTVSERRFRSGRSDFDNNKLIRYEDMFKKPDLFVEIANKYVPFLNGGLFDCLDDKANGNYIDGFSDRKVVKGTLIVPDYLFFGEEVGKDIDLSEFYGDKNKKKVSARGIIDILKRYNFTIEENTPFDQEISLDPELLGKVFENLLASFNPETKTTARKQTGSFYTPREIVQYMVDESLIAHLKRTVDDELEDEYRKLMKYTSDKLTLSPEQRKAIMKALYDCKILDPACGSGAFPMGILQQMVHILAQLDPDNTEWKEMLMENAIGETTDAYHTASDKERAEIIKDIEQSFNEDVNRPDYARKLYLIERCIFGVDIQSIAVQISKLRFFISLVVDQKANENPAENFGIRPLPNLEAKFIAANTLIGLNKKDVSLFDTQAIKDKEAELKLAKHKIFGAKTYKTKNKYKNRVAQLRFEIATLLKDSGAVGNQEAHQLQEWDMFDQNASSPFFDAEWMFGVEDGFDIVIGNPPYAQMQSMNTATKSLYKGGEFKTYSPTGDIYQLFYERAFTLLAHKGIVSFITSNKWMRAGYGITTREYFNSFVTVYKLLDLGAGRFETATVDTNIIFYGYRDCKEKNIQNFIPALSFSQDLNKLSSLNDNDITGSIQSSGDAWIILNGKEKVILDKMKKVGTPLKEWDISINYGIKTGYNEAFIIDGVTKDKLIAQDPKSKEILKPLLRGRDVKRYSYEFADKWLIGTFPALHLNIDEYHAIKKYLEEFRPRIDQTGEIGSRKKTFNQWFETQDTIAYYQDFEKPKIVWKRIGSRICFSYSKDSLYCLDSTCIAIAKNLKTLYFILSVLNSKLAESFLLTNSPKTGTGDVITSVQALDPFPIPVPTPEQEKEITAIVEKILAKKEAGEDTHKEETKIDQLVYAMYGLTNAEIKIIEGR